MNRLAACIVISSGVIMNGCFGPSINGSGHVTTENRNVGGGFSSVSLGGSGRLLIEQGPSESVTVTADDNLLSYVETEVHGGTLVLRQKSNFSLSPTGEIVFKVTLKKLDDLDISGSGTAEAKGIQNSRLKIGISGSGEATFAGAADDLDVTISGSGRFHGEGLKSKRTSVDISGSGGAVVASSETLNATVSGSGSIDYIGDPKVRQNISGSGSVQRR